jgi:hypothetical protein
MFLKIQLLWVLQLPTRTSAIIALITDAINQLRSPNPEIEMGPSIVTTIPPPTMIRVHIANKNPKSPGFKMKLPS